MFQCTDGAVPWVAGDFGEVGGSSGRCARKELEKSNFLNTSCPARIAQRCRKKFPQQWLCPAVASHKDHGSVSIP
jgi:hypothetical protein